MKLISNIFIAVFLINCTTAFSQGRKELIKFADAAFENGNYSSAAYFYGKIVGSFASDEKDLVYPYRLTPWNRPPKQSQPDSAGIIDTTLFIEDTLTRIQPIDALVFTPDTVEVEDSTSAVNIDTTKTYNVTYMNTITPHYWKERYGKYPHRGPVTARQISGKDLAEMVANGGYFYNSTYPALEILKIEETHEVTWEMVTSNGQWSCN